MDGWRNPTRWARTGRWLLLPIAVLDWVALAPQTIVVLAFLIAVLGLAGIAAALVAHMLRRSRGAMAGVGIALLLGGLVVFGLDPFPGSFPLIDPWWPESITQPQVVGSAYWQLAGLGIELAGVGMLATLLVVTLTGKPTRR
ncbi:disulfide bond formation protein B [Curtobacterium sp. MCPF17_002]|uniref:disulfide bond formation protein B n=1 Tax=Curtobacterium sp. MCPF17_002 TaxID=2175645 RepID=UPI000DA7EE62|nr:disulfide bond formation protein B [Curtobacterium sp. MCPF17_002]WIB77435.1 disulfide bond formation protein B [Curtobacterium sp. MCPF17_002]